VTRVLRSRAFSTLSERWWHGRAASGPRRHCPLLRGEELDAGWDHAWPGPGSGGAPTSEGRHIGTPRRAGQTSGRKNKVGLPLLHDPGPWGLASRTGARGRRRREVRAGALGQVPPGPAPPRPRHQGPSRARPQPECDGSGPGRPEPTPVGTLGSRPSAAWAAGRRPRPPNVTCRSAPIGPGRPGIRSPSGTGGRRIPRSWSSRSRNPRWVSWGMPAGVGEVLEHVGQHHVSDRPAPERILQEPEAGGGLAQAGPEPFVPPASAGGAGRRPGRPGPRAKAARASSPRRAPPPPAAAPRPSPPPGPGRGLGPTARPATGGPGRSGRSAPPPRPAPSAPRARPWAPWPRSQARQRRRPGPRAAHDGGESCWGSSPQEARSSDIPEDGLSSGKVVPLSRCVAARSRARCSAAASRSGMA
jgi:hypothetical protein